MPIQRLLADTALDRLRKRPVVAILGARQVGKTTLSHLLVKRLGRPSVRLDLEDPDDRAILRNAKEYLLAHTDELVVIDEAQRMPELFPLLRTLVDRDRRAGRFLLLGSSSPVIVQRASESLAGRVAYLDLYPFSVHEVPRRQQDRLWLRGGYPDAFLADSDADASAVQRDLLRSFTERDLPELGLRANAGTALQLLRMLASTHGSVLNMTMLARSIGLSPPTVKHYLGFFEAAYVTFALPSFQTNLRKRLIRAPKVYITDSGMLHALLNVRSHDDLFGHHLRGASWEGFVAQQVRARLEGRAELCHFRTQDGSELDLLVVRGNKVLAAVEVKSTNSPSLSKGNMLAYEAVQAPVRLVVTPSAKDHPYGQGITVCSLATLWDHLEAAVR